MVCLSDEGTVPVVVRDTICSASKRNPSVINLSPSKSVESIFLEVGAEFHYNPEGFELILQNSTGDMVKY